MDAPSVENDNRRASHGAETDRAAETVERLLSVCVARGASDLHLAPELPPYYRAASTARVRAVRRRRRRG
jgi:hypothetical protein